MFGGLKATFVFWSEFNLSFFRFVRLGGWLDKLGLKLTQSTLWVGAELANSTDKIGLHLYHSHIELFTFMRRTQNSIKPYPNPKSVHVGPKNHKTTEKFSQNPKTDLKGT